MKMSMIVAVLIALGLFQNSQAEARSQNPRRSKTLRTAPAQLGHPSYSSMTDFEREYARERITEQENASRPRSFPRNY